MQRCSYSESIIHYYWGVFQRVRERETWGQIKKDVLYEVHNLLDVTSTPTPSHYVDGATTLGVALHLCCMDMNNNTHTYMSKANVC